MPVLILGVGGTGTQIVKGVKSLLEEWRGRVPAHVALGVIDAKVDAPEGGRVPGLHFRPNYAIRFVDDFHEKRVAGLLDWWPETLMPSGDTDFSSGCGAIRAFGRYYAFRYADHVAATVRAMLDDVTALNIRSVGALGGDWRVFVVGSLGNGTCGGSFLDVATIARAEVTRHMPNVQVHGTGVFIAGSVTRGGNSGRLADRVGANGYGALLELQYEFNRYGAAGVRPRSPRTLRAAEGTWSFSPSPDDPPLHGAYLLEGRNLAGQTLDYPSLIHMAAHGLANLVAGVDDAQRLLDSWAASPSPRRLGSLAGVTLAVPAQQLTKWLVAEWGAQVAGTALSAADGPWRAVLADVAPDGTKRLLPEAATVDASVDFFLEHVLRMREVGPDGGNQFNQVFELFGPDDEALKKGLDRVTSNLAGAEKPDDAVAAASQLVDWVERNVKGLAAARTAALLDGTRSRWSRVPPNPDNPADAGLRWLIDQRVGRFVDAGAIGVLQVWIRELCDELARNRDSIAIHETRAWLNRPQDGNLDLQARLTTLRREAEGFWSLFRRGKIVELGAEVKDDARRFFTFHLWDTKIGAVTNLYDRAIGYLRALGSAADQLGALLRAPRLLGQLQAVAETEASALDGADRGARDTGRNAVRPVIPVGGGETTRRRLLARVASGASTSAEAVLRSLSEPLRERFAAALLALPRAEQEELVAWRRQGVTPLDQVASDSANRLRETLEGVIAARADATLRSETRIDALLFEEASALVRRLEQIQTAERDAIDRKERTTWEQEVEGRAGRAAAAAMGHLTFADAEADRLTARNLYLAGRIGQAISFATPFWSLRPQARGVPTRYCFVIYPKEATLIGPAIQAHGQHMAGADLPTIHATASATIDPRTVFVAQAHVGASLFDLNLQSEHDLYERMPAADQTYWPHTTREYSQAARSMLHGTGSTTDWGAPLLALAEGQGILARSEGGPWTLTRRIPGDAAAGRRAFAAGQVGPAGEVELLDWLGGSTTEATNLRDGLRGLLWESLRAQAASAGWGAPADTLQDLAAALRQRASAVVDPLHRQALDRQARAMDDLARELVNLAGAEIPAVLRVGAG